VINVHFNFNFTLKVENIIINVLKRSLIENHKFMMAPNQGDANTNKNPVIHASGSLADNDDVFQNKRKMPKWDIDEDIVISGIAGRFPESDTLDEFADNLYKNINMITLDDRRWPTGNKRKICLKLLIRWTILKLLHDLFYFVRFE